MKSALQTDIITSNASYLWFLTLSYTVVLMLANWFDPRLIQIFGFTTDAGTLVFPLTFLLSDLITEIYGYKHARRAVWCGFLFNAIFIIFGQLIIHLPSPDYPTNNAAFDAILAMNKRIILASCISYFCAEPLNAMVMAKLKLKLAGRLLGLRFVLSTFFSSAIDSVLFGIIAFYGVIGNKPLLSLILTMWVMKILIEIMGLPISISLARKLKQVEQLDIYDENTNFNIFKLDSKYTPMNNKF